MDKFLDASLNVLFIEDDPRYAEILKKRLSNVSRPSFCVQHVDRLRSGLDQLAASRSDVILLDLNLPDSRGLETLARIHATAPDIPVVVSTGMADEATGVEALRQGAEDFLIKGRANGDLISRVLQHSVERHRQRLELKNLSLHDELTGFFNRRGLTILGQQQIKRALRTKSCFLLFFIDLEGLKPLSDTLGAIAGDRIIFDFSHILRATFRDSDILARIGGEAFVALCDTTDQDLADVVSARLRSNVQRRWSNDESRRPLSISIGLEAFDPHIPSTIEDLMARADQRMRDSKVTPPSQPDPASSSHAPAPARKAFKKTILIIEDDENTAKFISYRLKNMDFDTRAVGDGLTGLDLAKNHRPHLIILDLGLPRLPGADVCKAIREDHDKAFARTPIIMLTAKNSDVDRVLGKVLGANDYIVKPFKTQDLIRKIQQLLK